LNRENDMARRVQVDVVSAEEQIFSGETEFAVFPGEMGELGIFPRHAPLLTRVRPGAVRLKLPERDEFELLYVSGGILEVQPTLITLLADTAIRAKDLDEAQAIKARQGAEEALRKRSANVDYAGAEAELAQTITQLRLHTLKKGRPANH
jgi:F-type H+-transporting ATPase subunit epsilon